MHCQCFNPPKTLKPMTEFCVIPYDQCAQKIYIKPCKHAYYYSSIIVVVFVFFRSIRVQRRTRRSAPTTLGVLSSTRGRKQIRRPSFPFYLVRILQGHYAESTGAKKPHYNLYLHSSLCTIYN